MKLNFVGFNGYHQYPTKKKTVTPDVVTVWAYLEVENGIDIQCTFRNVVVKTTNNFIIFGFLNEKDNKDYVELPFPCLPRSYLATEDFIVVSNGINIMKCFYNEEWVEIKFSGKEVESMNGKEIIQMTYFFSMQSVIILLSDGSAWRFDKNEKLSNIYSPILDKAISLTSGFEHILILTESGCVLSFGNSSHGQLGHGDLDSLETPLQVMALGGLKVIKIAAGGWHSCAVTDSGDLYVWGWNNFGQLTKIQDCKSNSDGLSLIPVPTLIDVGSENTKVVDVACGSRHTLVMTEYGTIYATGWNAYAQLGIYNLTSESINEFKRVDINNLKGKLICGPWSSILYYTDIDPD